MYNKLSTLLNKNKEENEDIDRYLSIPYNEINKDLKERIMELEKRGEEWSKTLQGKYTNEFRSQGKQNLKIWVCRDIDGDQLEDLTSEYCLEKEYRSQIAIDFDDQTSERDDFYVHYINLWYYFGGHIKGSGTLYNVSKRSIELDIEEALKYFLNK